MEQVRTETGYPIEIFPKIEYTNRGRLDIIEYTKQLPLLRQAIIDSIPEKCRPKSFEELFKDFQKIMDDYLI